MGIVDEIRRGVVVGTRASGRPASGVKFIAVRIGWIARSVGSAEALQPF